MELVKESIGDVYYGRAMDCLQTLREEGLKVGTEKGEGQPDGGTRNLSFFCSVFKWKCLMISFTS